MTLIQRIPLRQRVVFLIAVLLLVTPVPHLHAQNCQPGDAQAAHYMSHYFYAVSAVMAFVPGWQIGALVFLGLGVAADAQEMLCGKAIY